MSVTNLFKRATSRRQTKRLCRINRTPRCVAREKKLTPCRRWWERTALNEDDYGERIKGPSTYKCEVNYRLRAPRWMPNEAPDDASAARRTRRTRQLLYLQFQLLHCFNLFRMGCRQFAAYAAVWREHAPFSSALSIKPVCLTALFILLCERENSAFYFRLLFYF